MFRETYFKIAQGLLSLLIVATITVSCELEPELPGNGNHTPPPPDEYVWREMPAIPDNLPPTHKRVSHYITVKNRKVRNFSVLYDTEEKVSYWVAYPMHRMYLSGDGRRSDNFIYDPYVASSDQMPVTGKSTYGTGHSRGHQIASADRYVTQEANNQTFYITNMTPQNYTLNGGEWAKLEGWVRARANTASRSDTLYVVSGCAIKTPTDQTVKHITTRGVKGAVPKAYYKVLLRTASGKQKFPTDDDAMCIGFWMENSAPNGIWSDHIKSVSEIEQLTGHTFFPAISSIIKDTYSTRDWGIY